MATDWLPAQLDRLIELRQRLHDEDFTDRHVQDLYAEYRRLLAQAVGALRPVVQRWVEAGLLQVECRDGDGRTTVLTPTGVCINGTLTLQCTPEDPSA